ncbi:hypothetical protein Efla_004051 [Eimeria flavescens]
MLSRCLGGEAISLQAEQLLEVGVRVIFVTPGDEREVEAPIVTEAIAAATHVSQCLLVEYSSTFIAMSPEDLESAIQRFLGKAVQREASALKVVKLWQLGAAVAVSEVATVGLVLPQECPVLHAHVSQIDQHSEAAQAPTYSLPHQRCALDTCVCVPVEAAVCLVGETCCVEGSRGADGVTADGVLATGTVGLSHQRDAVNAGPRVAPWR